MARSRDHTDGCAAAEPGAALVAGGFVILDDAASRVDGVNASVVVG